jgi:DNA excision repair protein ERCC-4
MKNNFTMMSKFMGQIMSLMQELLEEIEEQRMKGIEVTEQIMTGEYADSTDIVMVACKDERSCLQLEDCIFKGPHQVQ